MSNELFDKRFVHIMWDDELEGKEGFFADDIYTLEDCVRNGCEMCTVTKSQNRKLPFHEKNEKGNYYSWRFFYYDPNYAVKCAYAEGKQIQCRPKGDTEETVWQDCEDEPGWYDDYNYRVKPADMYVILSRTPPLSLCYTDSPKKYPQTYFKGSKIECTGYIETHHHLAEVMKAWEDGKTIQFSLGGSWLDVTGKPAWNPETSYRVKSEETKARRMTYRELAEWLAKGNGQYRTMQMGATTYTHLAVYSPNEENSVSCDILIRRWVSDEWIEPTADIFIKDCRPVEANDGC